MDGCHGNRAFCVVVGCLATCGITSYEDVWTSRPTGILSEDKTGGHVMALLAFYWSVVCKPMAIMMVCYSHLEMYIVDRSPCESHIAK